MTHAIPHNPEAVASLMAAIPTPTAAHLTAARSLLGEGLRASMTNTALYGLPLEQTLPTGFSADTAHQFIHPHNVATALLNLCVSGPKLGVEALSPPEGLMVWLGQWVGLEACTFSTVTVNIPAQAPAAAAAPQATSAPLTGETQQALSLPETTQASLPPVELAWPRGEGPGRPKKSRFEVKAEPPKRLTPKPAWWSEFAPVLPRVLTVDPREAITSESSGVQPLMAYGLAVDVIEQALSQVPQSLTVGECRAFLSDLHAALLECDAKDVMFALADAYRA